MHEQVKGFLEENGTRLEAPRLVGKWDNAMYAELEDGSQQLLWKASPLPSNPTRCCQSVTSLTASDMTCSLQKWRCPAGVYMCRASWAAGRQPCSYCRQAFT